MVKLTSEEILHYQRARNGVVAAIVENFSLLKFSGADHLTFLQGQTTNDILSLKDGEGQFTAILEPKAKVRTLATVYRCKDCVYMVLPTLSCERLVAHLNKYIVMDDVQLDLLNYQFLFVSGPESRIYLEQFFGTELRPRQFGEHQQLCWSERSISLAMYNLTGEFGFLFFVKSAQEFYRELNNFKTLPLLNNRVQEVLRIEAGVVSFGQDVSFETLFPETNLQGEFVSYTKGCFVGQEIVARVKYRGSVNRAIVGLIFEDTAPSQLGEFQVRGQLAGLTTSLVFSEYKKCYIAICYINKAHRSPGTRINLETTEGIFKAEVIFLPFYQRQSELEIAKKYYDQALQIFSQGALKNDGEVEVLLRRAIRHNPKFADAYEVLGVLLSRNERYDEAIELMKKLKEMSPDTIMAYSNLSLFYMKKGMIQEAEDEKAAATATSFKLAAKERKERLETEQKQVFQQGEISKKLGMFQQVLEIDADDLVANFGLGKILIQLNRHKEAIVYLEKCLIIKKDYTQAYLQLGLAYLNEGLFEDAKKIFKNGIDCAMKNGDLMPKNEMERHLLALTAEKPVE